MTALACDRCGCRSEWQAAFTPTRDGTVKRLYCPPCSARDQRKQERWLIAGTAASALAIAIYATRGLSGTAPFVLLAYFTFNASQPVLTVLHELGHLLAAKLARVPVRAVLIGREPWFLDREIAGVRWRIGGLMLGGAVIHEVCDGPRAMARSAWIAAGGPLMNFAIAVVLFLVAWYWPPARNHAVASLVLLVLAATNAWLCVANLWPRTIRGTTGTLPSDGARLLALWRGTAEDPRDGRAGGHYLRAYFAFADRRLEIARIEIARAIELFTDPRARAASTVLATAVQCDSDQAREAADVLRPLLADESVDEGVRAGLANNLAWSCLLLDEPERFDEGLLAVAEARRIAPWERASISTQACLLAATATPGNGRAAEARRLVESLEPPARTPSERASVAATRGLVALADADPATARAQLSLVRECGASPALLRLLERRIASP